MKKLLPVITVLVFILASCNLPISNATPDANDVATRVAQTMAALPTTAATEPVPPVEPSLPPVEQPTPTNTESPTPTASATPTTAPTDPKLTLGDPTYYNDLSNYSAFFRPEDYPFEDSALIITVENGAMVFKSLKTGRGLRWRLTSRDPKNLYLEATFKTISCSGDDKYGIVFRAPTYGDGYGYYFGITCSGSYYLLAQNGSKSTMIVDSTPDTHILPGPNQQNRIGVMAVNESIKLYINGVLVKELTDNSLKEKGYIGAFISAVDDPGFTVHMQEISSWSLP